MNLLTKGRATGREIVSLGSGALEYVGFDAYRLAPGEPLELPAAQTELCVVLLCGAVDVDVTHPGHGEHRWANLRGRASVFDDAAPYAVYAPSRSTVRVTALADDARGAEVAICRAPGDPGAGLPPRLIVPASIARTVRGAGSNTRTVRDILPENAAAHSLLVVEVVTPPGHASSYPPHRHDTARPGQETFLEETYYHRVAPEQGFVFQRVYTDDRSLDEAMAVENHDVVRVPRGYHPVVVPHGYTSYYLNVMAGPERKWLFHNDPRHAWLLAGRAATQTGKNAYD